MDRKYVLYFVDSFHFSTSSTGTVHLKHDRIDFKCKYRAVSLKTTGFKSRGVLPITFAKPKISQTCLYVSCTSAQGAHFHY